jgi:hypothetical protein
LKRDQFNEIATFVINAFGDGCHPMAKPETLPFYSRSYIRKCLRRAAKSKDITDAARKLAN